MIKQTKNLIVILIFAVIIISAVFAGWIYFTKPQTSNVQQNKSITLSYPNPYDTSKNDTIALVNGRILLSDTGGVKPRTYDVAATATGDLDGDGIPDGVIGLYQGFGANRITPIIFVVSIKTGVATQIDYALPDQSVWQDETQIKSLSINNGILTVNLLVLDPKNYGLPHYEQTATVAKSVQYKLENGKLIIIQ